MDEKLRREATLLRIKAILLVLPLFFFSNPSPLIVSLTTILADLTAYEADLIVKNGNRENYLSQLRDSFWSACEDVVYQFIPDLADQEENHHQLWANG